MNTRTFTSNLVTFAVSAMIAGVLITSRPAWAATATWTQTAGGTYSWNANTTPPWDTGSFPNAVDDIASLNLNITGNQTINLNQAITVGTLNFGDTSGNQTQTIAPNGGSLTFDVSAGNAALTKAAGGTGNSTISAGVTLNDNLEVTNSSTARIVWNATVTGPGGITLNGGYLEMRSGSAQHAYTGNLTINNGATLLYDDTGDPGDGLGSGNLTINDGVLENYWADTFSRSLGSGSNQFRITGGTSGFSGQGNSGLTVRINNNTSYEVVWGSTDFNPSTLVLQAATANTNGDVVFQNRVDLNGATRTVTVNSNNEAAGGTAQMTGIIRDSVGSGGLIKTGPGLLILTAANTFTGGVQIDGGTVRITNNSGLGDGGPLTFAGSGAKLDLRASPTIGDLSGTSTYGLITSGTAGARTLTVNQTGNTTFGGVIENGIGTVALIKNGGGTLTLTGANTYTDVTSVNAGTLLVNGSLGNTAVSVAAGATLGGNGTIGGNTTIFGAHAPGSSAGLLSHSSALTYSGGASTVEWELLSNAIATRGTDFDGFDVGGNLDFAAATTLDLIFNSVGSTVNWNDAFWQSDYLGAGGWLIYDVAGSTSNVGNLSLAAGPFLDSLGNPSTGTFSLFQDGADIYLNHVAFVIPEPTSLALLAMGLLALARRKRRS